jgi:glucose/arabinose dehydrogenase
MSQPVALAVRPGDPALYVAEQGGRVRAIRDGAVDPNPVVDLMGATTSSGERGLLGLAFSPDAAFLYIHYTDSTNGDVHVDEYPAGGGRGPGRSVLSIQHRDYGNHNGGQLAFGPDGMLYVGVGDGGGGGDPNGNAQNTGVLLGKVLRIDPPRGGTGYTVPPGNPFGNAVWHYGLRNPWRFSFDRATGEMWIGDVGQGSWEEVDQAPAGVGGRNYGWNGREGAHPYPGGVPAANAVDPVYEYSHGGGSGVCAVTGGYVYRGAKLPSLNGAYVFADYCVGRIWGFRSGAGRTDVGLSVPQLSSFGEDLVGELYALSLTGAVYRIDPA